MLSPISHFQSIHTLHSPYLKHLNARCRCRASSTTIYTLYIIYYYYYKTKTMKYTESTCARALENSLYKRFPAAHTKKNLHLSFQRRTKRGKKWNKNHLFSFVLRLGPVHLLALAVCVCIVMCARYGICGTQNFSFGSSRSLFIDSNNT